MKHVINVKNVIIDNDFSRLHMKMKYILFCCSLLLLYSNVTEPANPVETYFRDMCLKFKELYWVNGTRPQFAVLTVGHTGGWDPAAPDYMYDPWPLVKGVNDIYNYASAAFDKNDKTKTHSEPKILPQLKKLWDKFKAKTGKAPTDVLVFTYNSPCISYGPHDCTRKIHTAKTSEYDKASWYVGYNQVFQPRAQNRTVAMRKLKEAETLLKQKHINLIKISSCAGKRKATTSKRPGPAAKNAKIVMSMVKPLLP